MRDRKENVMGRDGNGWGRWGGYGVEDSCSGGDIDQDGFVMETMSKTTVLICYC